MSTSLLVLAMASLQQPLSSASLGTEGFLDSHAGLNWSHALPLRPARDGQPGYFFHYATRTNPVSGNGEYPYYLVNGGRPHTPELVKVCDPLQLPYLVPRPWEQPSVALLESLTSDDMVYVDNAEINVVDTVSRQSRGRVALPQGAVWFEMLQACGDLDGDGWEDLYFHAHDGWTLQTGVIDGQSLTISWTSPRSPRYSPAPPMDSGFGAPSDLDGDGVRDVVHSAAYWNAALGNPDVVVATLSGADGSTLWKTALPNTQIPYLDPGFMECMTGPDLDGDGHREVAVHTWDSIALLDGGTGAVLWTTPLAPLTPLLPGNQVWFRPMSPLHWDQVPGHPGEYTVAFPNQLPGTGPWYASQYVILRFDPLTGQLASYDEMPADMMPWSEVDPERPGPLNCNDFYFLGDVDGDGFTELAKAVTGARTPLGTYPRRLTFLGIPSLRAPRFRTGGSQLDVAFSVPSSPGHPVRLAVGAGFQPLGGRTIQGWSTYLQDLVPLPGGPLLHGTLDTQGETTFSFQVPWNPQLVGHDFHLRGIVLDATTPGRIRTMTNPVTVTVLP